MKVNIRREATKPRTFADLEAGQLFGYRGSPIVMVVLNPLDRSDNNNALVVVPTAVISAGRGISVSPDREIVLVTEVTVTFEF